MADVYDCIKYFTLADGTEIEYADLGGKGPTLLFIPGYSLSCDLVVPVLAHLTEYFRCVTLTLRGFGGANPRFKGSEAKGELTLKQAAKDIKELMEYLQLKDVIAVGYSMGTHVAFSYIQLFGCENISRFIILDMTPKLINEDGWTGGLYQGHYTRERYELDLKAMDSDYQKDFNNYFFYQASFPHTREEVRDYVFTEDMQKAVDAYAAGYGIPGFTGAMLTYLAPNKWPIYKSYWNEMCVNDFRGMLKDITVPTGIFHAVPGSIYDIQTAKYLEANIPGSKRYPIENAVHTSLIMASAGEFFKQIFAFLADNR